jgi:hypothetical protein
MIFILKRGRFGNYLFQFFVAKIIQSYNNSQIVTISKNENIYHFNSKKNIDSIVSEYHHIPYISILIKFIFYFAFQLTDKNISTVSSNFFLKKKLFIINGFFQDYSLIKKKSFLLKKIIKKSSEFKINLNIFKKSDLTIHIRYLHKDLKDLDAHPKYSRQPDIRFYRQIINKLNPQTIKIISSKKSKIFYEIKKSFPKKIIFYEGFSDLYDFYNLINSTNLIISNSTFAFWGALLSKAKKIYAPRFGLFDNNSKLMIRNDKRFVFIK